MPDYNSLQNRDAFVVWERCTIPGVMTGHPKTARVLVCAAAIVFVGCSVSAQKDNPTPGMQTLDGAYAQLGFDILRKLSATRPSGNVFISPTSIAVALAMVSNGASGSTRDAIMATLHTGGRSVENLNDANRDLVHETSGIGTVQLSLANALWLQKTLPADPAFSASLRKAYGASVENLDFRDPSSVQTINNWIAQQTAGRIPKLLDAVDPSQDLILTNAIAFKGKWTSPFSPRDTRTKGFKTADRTVKVSMMLNGSYYAYAEGDGLQTICLPYADGEVAMYVVLPSDPKRLQSFLQHLTPSDFEALISSMHSQYGFIQLPRFKIANHYSLTQTLTELGMGIAFGDKANFDGIHKSSPPIRIGDVVHASSLAVDEYGSEAAAATGLGMAAPSSVHPKAFDMIVDHSFFVSIRDERNHQILFAGVITNP